MLVKFLILVISQLILMNHIKSQDTDFEYISYGAITDNSFRIKAKSNSVKTLTLILNKNTTIGNIFSADADGYFDIILSNLKSDSIYTFDFQVNGNLLNLNKQFTTMPASNSTNVNLNFVVSSFSKTNTKKNTWEKIKAIKPNFFIMLGNMYDDIINGESWKNYESVFLDGILLNEFIRFQFIKKIIKFILLFFI